MSKSGKVLVAMSGGIDSTMAAIMLHQQGYEVVGITMKTWEYAPTVASNKKETGCCTIDSFNDARQAAVDNGFPHYILDIHEEFNEHVVNDFVNEYLAGRTPNPCIMCNTHIKWRALLKKADALKCDWIATGHYAKINQHNNRYFVSKGLDETKDQSYVLWGLEQDLLQRTIFPIGNLVKKDIKKTVVDLGYEQIANKPESYEICFIPDNDYRSFLKTKDPTLEARVQGGKFVDTSGNVIGEHKGYPFYTIGQRKKLNIALGYPAFVTDIQPETNTVTIGKEEDLQQKNISVRKITLQKYTSIDDTMQAVTKIRYRDKGTASVIAMPEKDRVVVRFNDYVKGVAPGQSAVFYEGEDVIGGGVIEKELV